MCSGYASRGIPLNALVECSSIFSSNAVIDGGILHHLSQSGCTKAVFCIGQPDELKEWRNEINSSLVGFAPQAKWWLGLDVGKSSAAIFAVFAEEGCWCHKAKKFGNGSTPADADDFGRCKRLLDMFPEWRTKLNKIVEAYPNTKWGKVIERWEELEKAEPKRQDEILKEIA